MRFGFDNSFCVLDTVRQITYLVGGGLVLTLACLDNLLELLKGDPLATELLGQV